MRPSPPPLEPPLEVLETFGGAKVSDDRPALNGASQNEEAKVSDKRPAQNGASQNEDAKVSDDRPAIKGSRKSKKK